MNHEEEEKKSADCIFFGETMFVRAKHALRKGTELTINYTGNSGKNTSHWGIP